MESLRRSLVWLVQVLHRRWFLLFTLYALYVYHLRLDKDMGCSCQSQARDCRVYLLVPGLVLFVVQLWVDLVFARGLRHVCGVPGATVRVAPVLCKRVLEAGLVGLLWVQSVLLDGDWYVCCGRGDIVCYSSRSRDRYDPFVPRPSSDEIRNESQMIGLLLSFAVFLVAAILSWLPWGRFCRATSCDWPEAVLEEAGLTASQRMRAAAQSHLQMKLEHNEADGKKWEELEGELLVCQAQVPPQVETSVLMSSLTNGGTE